MLHLVDLCPDCSDYNLGVKSAQGVTCFTYIGEKPTLQMSFPQKSLGQSKPNFLWSLHRLRAWKLFATSWSHDKDGRYAFIW